MNLILHFPKICGRGEQGQSGWGFVCLRVASIILWPLMTPPDRGAPSQPLNVLSKVPSLPVRDNQGCLLVPGIQPVQLSWIPTPASWQRGNPANEKSQSPAVHGSELPVPAHLAFVCSAWLSLKWMEFWLCCVLCSRLPQHHGIEYRFQSRAGHRNHPCPLLTLHRRQWHSRQPVTESWTQKHRCPVPPWESCYCFFQPEASSTMYGDLPK